MLICSAPLLCPTSRHGGTGECLDEVALDGAQLISAAEIGLNGRHEPVEDLRRARPAVELAAGEQPRQARPMSAATGGFPGAFRGLSWGYGTQKHGYGPWRAAPVMRFILFFNDLEAHFRG